MTISVDQFIRQAYQVIGRSEKLRPDAIDDAVRSLDLMFDSWLNRGVDIWRAKESVLQIYTPTVVSNDSSYYYCIRTHVADDDSEPGTGDTWASFWLETDSSDDAIAWTSGSPYTAINTLDLDIDDLFSVVGFGRYLLGSVETRVKFINRRAFQELDPVELGSPTKACFVPGTATESPRILLHPAPTVRSILYLTAVTFRADPTTGLSSPRNWMQAIKYGLAVELAYANNIPRDVLAGIVEKFTFEFRKARGADREVLDRCFVESAY